MIFVLNTFKLSRVLPEKLGSRIRVGQLGLECGAPAGRRGSAMPTVRPEFGLVSRIVVGIQTADANQVPEFRSERLSNGGVAECRSCLEQ
jgi:hypothetical protein